MIIIGERGSTLPPVIGGGGTILPPCIIIGRVEVHSTPGYGGKGVHSNHAVFPFIPYKVPTCKTGNSKVY